MKAVILAGGRGTRIEEESCLKPKPMVLIGGQPVLWHIMKVYSAYGIQEFIICCGYKGQLIKDYFIDYAAHHSDITSNLENGDFCVHRKPAEKWKVTLVNTGLHTKTAGRLLKVREYLGQEPFCLTYGDGVANVNINELLKFHKSHGKAATITVAKPEGRFGMLDIDAGNYVRSFREKSRDGQAWVNAGFAVFSPKVFTYLGDGESMLEEAPYENLARDGEMKAYQHPGQWAPMDTIHERDYLDNLWNTDQAFWKVWEN